MNSRMKPHALDQSNKELVNIANNVMVRERLWDLCNAYV